MYQHCHANFHMSFQYSGECLLSVLPGFTTLKNSLKQLKHSIGTWAGNKASEMFRRSYVSERKELSVFTGINHLEMKLAYIPLPVYQSPESDIPHAYIKCMWFRVCD